MGQLNSQKGTERVELEENLQPQGSKPISLMGLGADTKDELVAAGVPKDRIVLAFHPPQVREHTGYALA
ncbi:element excision factor XisI family protein [Planktothrix agardhii]